MSTVLMMTDRGKPALQYPLAPEGNLTLCYGFGAPLQLTPQRAGILANLRVCARDGKGIPDYDVEGGADLVVFDRLDGISAGRAIPLFRNHAETHPETGEPAVMVKYLGLGGFVPLGTKRSDGQPHPHTGTGFGLSYCLAIHADTYTWRFDFAADHPFHEYLELQQYAYDGRTFSIRSTHRLPCDQLVAGQFIPMFPLSTAIPDGDDLLFALASRAPTREGELSLLIGRWRYLDDGWRVVECHPVDGGKPFFEPSLIRDIDGSLLLTGRGQSFGEQIGLGSKTEACVAWRSTDGGRRWQKLFDYDRKRNETPTAIHRTVDGVPFLAVNPYRVPTGYRPNGRPFISIQIRDTLALYPLASDRQHLEQPLRVFDCVEKFGRAPYSIWRADHPIGSVVRLADNRLHCILCFRVQEAHECDGDALPTIHTGLWVEEVRTLDPGTTEYPLWQF